MSILKNFAAMLMLFFSSIAFAQNPLSGRTFVHKYENGNEYELRYKDHVVTWLGTKGADVGKTEADAYKLVEVSKNIYLVQWREKDGTVVHLALDLKNRKVAASILYGGAAQLIKGTVEREIK